MIGAENQQATRRWFTNTAGESSETTRQTSRLNGELTMLIALLFTDGCVSPKGNSWRIYFSNKSWNLIDLFRACMVAVFEVPLGRVRLKNIKNGNGAIAAIIDSKEIGDYLTGRFGTFRTLSFDDGTLPNARLPLSELIMSRCADIFLRAAFSCDGGISFYPVFRNKKRWLSRTIFLSCSHPRLRSDYAELLSAIGIRARNVPGDNKIKIESQENIKKFYQHIGFLEGTMVTDHSRYWRGYTKQKLLGMLVASYQDSKVIYQLPQFKRDDDIVQPA